MVSLSPTRPGPSRGSTQVTPAERAAGSQPTALPVACCWASPDGKCARRHGVLLGPALATPGTPGLAYVHRLCTCRRRGATHGRSPVPAPRARRGHRPTSSPVEVDRRSALPFPRPEGSSAVPDAQRREARPGDGRPPGAARLDRPARQPFHPRNDGHLLALFRWRDGRSMGRTMGLFHGLDYRSNTGTTAQCVNRDTVTGFYKIVVTVTGSLASARIYIAQTGDGVRAPPARAPKPRYPRGSGPTSATLLPGHRPGCSGRGRPGLPGASRWPASR